MPAFSAKEIISIGTTIDILFYGDVRDTNVAAVPQPSPGSQLRGEPTEFGLRILKDTLEAQSTFMTRFSVDVLLRHHKLKSDGFPEADARPGLNKLTPALLKKYDQVWFFGQQYANLRQWFDDYGGPESGAPTQTRISPARGTRQPSARPRLSVLPRRLGSTRCCSTKLTSLEWSPVISTPPPASIHDCSAATSASVSSLSGPP